MGAWSIRCLELGPCSLSTPKIQVSEMQSLASVLPPPHAMPMFRVLPRPAGARDPVSIILITATGLLPSWWPQHLHYLTLQHTQGLSLSSVESHEGSFPLQVTAHPLTVGQFTLWPQDGAVALVIIYQVQKQATECSLRPFLLQSLHQETLPLHILSSGHNLPTPKSRVRAPYLR